MLLPASACSSGAAVEIVSKQYADYQADRFEAAPFEGDAIHAIGIYEGGSRHGPGSHPLEDVTVEVADQGSRSIYLALSSYEPVRWIVTGPGAASVKGVYLDGYHNQQVVGVQNGKVIDRSARRNGDYSSPDLGDAGWGVKTTLSTFAPVSCTYTYLEPSGGGCDSAHQFLANAHGMFGAPIASFTGIYNAQHFRIR